MNDHFVTLTVLGAKEICPSCVGAPSSENTYEWLQAAIARKYEDDFIHYEYVDINENHTIESHKKVIKSIFEEEFFYPVVMINEKVVDEGVIQLKPVYQALENHGIQLLIE